MMKTSCGLIAALLALLLLLTACEQENNQPADVQADPVNEQVEQPTNTTNNNDPMNEEQLEPELASPDPEPSAAPVLPGQETVEVVAEPEAVAVLINKTYALPKDYEPADLIEPEVPFIFEEHSAKRTMRKEAAEALEVLFKSAKQEGVGLAGVSGYRSYATQKALFERYVQRDGEAAASRYSARPGHSEHSTGLAMDVTGSDGKCAAQDCFGGTKAAIWLADHAHEYGFIIRYPDGKEEITGYKYEPWHLRYVGVELAAELTEKGLTLEEYYADSVPVSN